MRAFGAALPSIPDPRAFEIIRQHVTRLGTVEEAELTAAMRCLFTDTHDVAEGAGAAALAALLREAPRRKGARSRSS